MLENFLDEMRFFTPSPELTKRLFAAVAAELRRDKILVSEDREQAEDVDEDYLKNLPRNEGEGIGSAASPLASASEQEELLLQRRFIAEELYHHLAFLCRSPAARRGQSIPISEAVAHGMANVLGLTLKEPLLGRLAEEFTDWLSEWGQFTTGWGNIILADGKQLYLEELRTPEKEAVTPSGRVFIPRPSQAHPPAIDAIKTGTTEDELS